MEHVEADDEDVKRRLVDTAVRVSREKHLQRVLFADANDNAEALKIWNPEALETDIAVVKTTKG